MGAIASLTVLLFGGWSGVVIGWLFGTAAGAISCRGKNVTINVGIRLGASSGFILGMWLLVASCVQGLIVRPISGQVAFGIFDVLLLGGAASVVAVLASSLMGALQGLPETRRHHAVWITVIFILLVFPLVDQVAQTNWIAAVVQIQIFIILALGLNITVGYAGLLDLGYAAFFAIGAYTTGLLSSPQVNLEWNFWLVIWIAVAVSAVAGIVLGSPTLRLRGDYLAIVTLGFGEIVPIVFRNLTSVRIDEPISKILSSVLGRPQMAICLLGCSQPINLTGGEAGINPIGRPVLPIIGTFAPSNYLPWYYLVLVMVVGCVLVSDHLRNSRMGRAWVAIREDELVASCMGINLVRTKLLAFAMGAAFAGFAGAFYAAYIGAIFPSVFGFSLSVIVLCMVVLGGLGNMTGVILGGIVITAADQLYLPQLAQVLKNILNVSILPYVASPQWKDFLATSLDPTQMRLFLFGMTLVLIVLVRPQGIVNR
ncbi:branched-chain amino acid ABC transporter permease [Iningainema sp. BLCCT55]|uniref:Branched-chain amino acid ABC transporter permease n=2 Tax=Iningainema TaxID=1932705 RepID=A0A8J7BZC9_9CYAN|nr:branched-chain amino acid ABC transporter permease [Iningainema tapete]MBD2775608.1 branched-chain amino acid ABC transporter permease [Iningainema tapete BLCC-T55]